MQIARFSLAALLALALAAPASAQDEAPPDAPEAPEEKGWTGKVSLGGNLSSGTTDSFGGAVDVGAERTWGKHEVKLGAFLSYGRTNSPGARAVTQTNEQRLTQYYSYSPTERFYWYGNLEQARDTVRNIELRLFANTGPGYRIWHVDDLNQLDGELGIGYRYEDYGGIRTVGREPSRNDVNGRAAFTFLRTLGIAQFGQTGEFLLPFNDTGGWIARGKTTLSFPLVAGWAFENALQMEYFNDPPSGSKSFELDYIVSLVNAF